MAWGPLSPARIAFGDDGVPQAPDFGDLYHPRAGALQQAQHVFLAGNGLPERWRGRRHFVVLECGFGLGHNFLATRAAWQADPARPAVLHYLALDRHPPLRTDLARALAGTPGAQDLLAAWPEATPDLHLLHFDGGAVRLHLALGDVAQVLPQWVAQVDAFYLDGFAPARNPAMWQPGVFKALARLAAPGATLATWSVAQALRAGLAAQGFEVHTAPGTGGKREITLARHAPRHVAPPPAGRRATPAHSAIVVGAGLAGALSARALARQGLPCTVLEQHAAPAQGSSGNPGGLYHGVVHGDDGPHARWLRACALHAQRVLAPLIETFVLPGQAAGLLRLAPGEPPARRQALQQRLGLPPGYAQAVDAALASRLAGLPLPHGGWWFPGGGWVDPAALVRWALQAPGVATRFGQAVATLRPVTGQWQALAADGAVLATADAVVLANAHGLPALWPATAGPLPLQRVRGQITQAMGGAVPRLPISGMGYVLPLAGAGLLCGATRDLGDDDPTLRAADHAANLAPWPQLQARPAGGRVGWRQESPDRLPLIGAVPDFNLPCARPDQVRHRPRTPGLYLLAALGSRGIAQALLGAEVLAACVTATPVPLPAALLDALDPARRFAARARS